MKHEHAYVNSALVVRLATRACVFSDYSGAIERIASVQVEHRSNVNGSPRQHSHISSNEWRGE